VSVGAVKNDAFHDIQKSRSRLGREHSAVNTWFDHVSIQTSLTFSATHDEI